MSAIIPLSQMEAKYLNITASILQFHYKPEHYCSERVHFQLKPVTVKPERKEVRDMDIST